jgi:hypothetical protein
VPLPLLLLLPSWHPRTCCFLAACQLASARYPPLNLKAYAFTNDDSQLEQVLVFMKDAEEQTDNRWVVSTHILQVGVVLQA